MAEARLRYKQQVLAAVQACALYHCDGLIIGCAEGILGAHLPMVMAAEVWAEVLFGEGNCRSVAFNFRAVTFGLGGCSNAARQKKNREALETVFANRGGSRLRGLCGAPRFTGP